MKYTVGRIYNQYLDEYKYAILLTDDNGDVFDPTKDQAESACAILNGRGGIELTSSAPYLAGFDVGYEEAKEKFGGIK